MESAKPAEEGPTREPTGLHRAAQSLLSWGSGGEGGPTHLQLPVPPKDPAKCGFSKENTSCFRTGIFILPYMVHYARTCVHATCQLHFRSVALGWKLMNHRLWLVYIETL